MRLNHRQRWIDPTNDPELISEARDLARLGEEAFYRDMAEGAATLVPNRPMGIAEFAKSHCFIPSGKTTRSGPVILTAVQRRLVKLLQTRGLEMLVVRKCPRIGSSTLTVIMLIYYAFWEQSDVLLYERTDDKCQEFNKDKLMPIIRASPKLRALLRPDGKTGEQDTWDNRELLNGASLKQRSISSDKNTKGVRGRFIAGDEVGDDAWQPGSEGSKTDLVLRRGQEFGDGKVYFGGTPTTLGSCLVSELYEKTNKCVFRMNCPHCGTRQEFVPDVRRVADKTIRYGPGLRYTLDETGVCDDAWYECKNEACDVRAIEETSKSRMLDTGDFEGTAVGVAGRVGAYVWMVHSEDPKATWKHIGEAHDQLFVKGCEEDRKSFVTMWLGQPFDATPISAMSAADLEARSEEWITVDGEIADAPEWVEAVFSSIDVQRGHQDDPDRPPRLEMLIHCVGKNQRHAVIDYKVLSHVELPDSLNPGRFQRLAAKPFSVESSEMVYEVLERELLTKDGRKLRIKRCFVDNGDLTEDANRFCMLPRSRRLGIIPIMGDGTDRGSTTKLLLPDNLTLRRAKKSGRAYLHLGTQSGKFSIAEMLTIPAPAPRSWVLAKHLPPSFYHGLLAEKVDEETGRWVRISEKNTGEPWDTLNYSYAAERYEMRKNGRLSKIVDEIDQDAADAALVARATAQAAAAKKGQAPAPAPAEPSPSRTGEDADQPVAESGGVRFRVVKRKTRQEPEKNADGVSDRVRRVRARRTGLGW